jgi:hypothetical protein
MITHLRPATAQDLPQLSHLWHEQAMLRAQSDGRFGTSTIEAWQQHILSLLDHPNATLLVAERQDENGPTGEIVGYILASVQPLGYPRLGLIQELALDMHSYQGGVARALVGAARRWFEAQDVNQVAVLVARRHAVEQAFWRALGGNEWMEVLWLNP